MLLPLAGEELPELHQYDLVPSTRHHSDAKESDHGQGKGKGVEGNDSEDDDGPSPIDILIRRSHLMSRSSHRVVRSFVRDLSARTSRSFGLREERALTVARDVGNP